MSEKLNELEDQLMQVDDTAGAAWKYAFAGRFVLGNLVLQLSKSGVIDGRDFILSLLSQSHRMADPGERHAVEELAEDLLRALGPIGTSGGKPFH